MPTTRFLSHIVSVLLLVTCICVAQDELKNQPTVWADKPDIAAFERSRTLARRCAEIRRPASRRERRAHHRQHARALRRSCAAAEYGNLLRRLMQQVHPDAKYRDAATAITTKVSTAASALSLNQDVYKALASLDLTKADAATKYYVQRQLLEFRLAGVDKDDATRKKLNELNTAPGDLQSTFERNIADDQPTVEAKPSELEGLPKDFVDKQKRAAERQRHHHRPMSRTLPGAAAGSRATTLRRRVWEAWIEPRLSQEPASAARHDEDALRDRQHHRLFVMGRLQRRRQDDRRRAAISRSSLPTWTRRRGPSPSANSPCCWPRRKRPIRRRTSIYGYESYHLTEMVRRSQYDFDSQTVRPYLPFNEVKQGVMNTAASLFHISFRQEQNVPSWDPSVETWDVIDNGKVIGRFYLDMFPAAGQVFAPADGRRSRRHSRQAAARSHAHLQLPAAHRYRPRPDAVQRRDVFLPRVRPPDAPHPRRTAAVGGHQRHHHGGRLRAKRRRRCWRSACAVRRCCRPSPSTTRRARRSRWS